MSNISILDCTLRDGGYINDWKFDRFNIVRIINSLGESNIDIIECGYISEKKESTKDNTIFSDISEIESLICKGNSKSLYVAMINLGEYDVNKLPVKSGNIKLDGIRLVFHKKNWKQAIKDIEIICNKGYKVFVQPMVILNYSDEEILSLIKACNELNIYAFYIVDSFGAMKNTEIIRISHIIKHNLRENINIGFHGHNNLQLAYSNAVEFINTCKDRNIIIDSSIFGMGRGAGNLPAELILNYLNLNYKGKYSIEPLLYIIDSYISRIYNKKYWGYSMAHYLSATYNCHPNYATYLVDKKTLTISDIEEILKYLECDKKVDYDKEYIEKLYSDYNSKILESNNDLIDFKKNIVDKDIYLLAPGKSLTENLQKINKNNSIVITINHVLNKFDSDYSFFSNQKRYIEYRDKVLSEEISDVKRKFICTSNVKHEEQKSDVIDISYHNILGSTVDARDNSMIMILNLLKILNKKEVFILGFDGFSKDSSYCEEYLEYELNELQMNAKNINIEKEIDILSKDLNIYFVTDSIYNKNLREVAIAVCE